MGLASAGLRLLAIRRGRASEILWAVKPQVVEVALASLAFTPQPDGECDHAFLQRLATFTPLLDLASMRHPTLATRLFIS